MKKIKAYVDYNEHLNKKFYRNFEVIDELPEIGDEFHLGERITNITPVRLDCEQGRDEVWSYDYYEIEIFNEKDKRDTPEDWEYEDSEFEHIYYVCVRMPDYDEYDEEE